MSEIITEGNFSEIDTLFPGNDESSELQKVIIAEEALKYFVSSTLRCAHKAIITNNPTSVDDFASNKCIIPVNNAKLRIKRILYRFLNVFGVIPSKDWETTSEDFDINIFIVTGGPEGFYLKANIFANPTYTTVSVTYPKYTEAEVKPTTHETAPNITMNHLCPLCENHSRVAIDPGMCDMHNNLSRRCNNCTLSKECACYHLVCPPEEVIIPTYCIVPVGDKCNVTDTIYVKQGEKGVIYVRPNDGYKLSDFRIDEFTFDDVTEANNVLAEMGIFITFEYIDDKITYTVTFNNVVHDHTCYFNCVEIPAIEEPYTIHVTTSSGVTCNATVNGNTGIDVNKYDDALIHFSISEYGHFTKITVDNFEFDSMESAIKILDDEEYIDAEMFADGSYGIRFIDVVSDHTVNIEIEMDQVQLSITESPSGNVIFDESVDMDSTQTIEFIVPENYHVEYIDSIEMVDNAEVNTEVYHHNEKEFSIGELIEEVLEDGTTKYTITIPNILQDTTLVVGVEGNATTVTVHTVNCKVIGLGDTVDEDGDLIPEEFEEYTFDTSKGYSTLYGKEFTFEIIKPRICKFEYITIDGISYSIDNLEDGEVVEVAGVTIIPQTMLADDGSYKYNVTIKSIDRTDDIHLYVVASRQTYTISEEIVNARIASPTLPMTVDAGTNLDVVITADPGTFFTSLVVTDGIVSATLKINPTSDVGDTALHSFGYMSWDKITRTYTVKFRNIEHSWKIMGSTVTFVGDDMVDTPDDTTPEEDETTDTTDPNENL